MLDARAADAQQRGAYTDDGLGTRRRAACTSAHSMLTGTQTSRLSSLKVSQARRQAHGCSEHARARTGIRDADRERTKGWIYWRARLGQSHERRASTYMSASQSENARLVARVRDGVRAPLATRHSSEGLTVTKLHRHVGQRGYAPGKGEFERRPVIL